MTGMTNSQPMIVSLTPSPLDRDSRTLKIAASLKRLGYGSIVVENLPSQSRFSSPVDVITLAGPGRRKSQGINAGMNGASPLPQWLRERAHFLVFITLYFFIRPIQGLFQVPRASLYYLHEYRLFPMVFLLSRLWGVPYIYDAHDYYPLVFDTDNLSPFWRKRFLPLLVWMDGLCVRHANAMVTVNQGIADLYHGQFNTDPVILRNSHDERLDLEVENGIRTALSLSADDFLIVSIGHNKESLAMDSFLEAVRDSDERVHVAFLGNGFGPVSERVAAMGLEGRVHFPGSVGAGEIVPFIKGADASVILYYPMTPDYEYSLPNKFFQSVAAGLPLLYPRLPEIERLAETHGLGISIDPKNADSIRKAIDTLLNDKDVRQKFSDNAQTARKALSWAEEEATLGSIVETLIPPSPKLT